MGLSFYRYPPIELVPSPLSNEYLKRPLGRIVISWKKSGNHHVIEKLQSDLTEVPEVDTQPPLKTERRRSSRFPAVIPVHVKWQEPTGKILKEGAQAKEVNAQGGLLDMKIYPWVGGNLELTNLLSGESTQARLVGTRHSEDGAFLGVAVALVVPSESFWGVDFQLRKTSADLAKIEQTIKSGGVDPRIVKEFRDAVDYVRKTAWAVQEWQERQLQKRDPLTVLPLLSAERIRRATQLSKAITADLTAHEVTRETAGMDEFFRAIEGLYQRVSDLLPATVKSDGLPKHPATRLVGIHGGT